MKRIIIALAALAISLPSTAWGGFGHQVVVELAKRHLTPKAEENIAKIISYDLVKDASWMDAHRNDADIAFTTNWHTYSANAKTLEYAPAARWSKGDVIQCIEMAAYNLERRESQTDELNLLSLRMLIHFVGDMHCPTHCGYVGQRSPVMTGFLGTKNFHSFYDSIPGIIYAGKTPLEVAESLDSFSKGKIRKTGKGTPIDWADDCARRCTLIYEINPPSETKKEIMPNPKSVELSKDLVDTQLRNAGYRLACLLNAIFG